MTDIEALLAEAKNHLSRNRVAEAAREARSLMGFVLGKNQAFIRAHPEYTLTAEERGLFIEAINRRGRREPFQHIVGRQEFFGLEFEVTPDVLVPRPETEHVVEKALELVGEVRDPISFADIGTGSGCIAISILKNLPKTVCVATDISHRALRVAKRNAQAHGVQDRVDLVCANIFEPFSETGLFDLVVANPPYVPVRDIDGLQPEVRDFDPRVALTDGADGISIIRRIFEQAQPRLHPAAPLIMEVGFRQADEVKGFASEEIWSEFAFVHDLQGIPRVIVVWKSA